MGDPHREHNGKGVLTAYQIFDVVMAAMVFAVVPRVPSETRPFLNFAALGLLCVAVSDSGIALQVAKQGTLTFGWPDLAVQVGLALLITGAWLPPGSQRGPRTGASRLDNVIIYLPVVAAIVVAVPYVADGNDLGFVGTAVGAAVASALMVRQMVLDRVLRSYTETQTHMALHDALTGLGNRAAFVDQLDAFLASPEPAPAAVLFADLNGFKEINDTLGHAQGDLALQASANQLRAVMGEGHVIARLGGDEFAALVVAEDPSLTAEMLATRLVRIDPTEKRPFAFTCSLGITVTRRGDTPGDVLRRADGVVWGAEALLRWTHPVLGAVPPQDFVPLAEESGEILSIGPWVLDTALARVAAWRACGRFLPQIFVNKAAAEFTEDLPHQVLASLKCHGLLPGQLILEVTESQILAPEVSGHAQRLRSLGVRIALDDFGSGFSSLAQLATLPVDVLKIDRGFILSLKESSGKKILDTVVTLATSLDLVTVAEGIESPAQVAAVLTSGIDLAQGFIFSQPLHPDDLQALLPAVSLDAKVLGR